MTNPSVVEALHYGKHCLNNESARLDAEILLANVLKQDRTYLYTWPEKMLSQTEFDAFNSLIQQRQEGVPVAYLTGQREFWGLNFVVNQHTLIPRPDTETLVEMALTKLQAPQHPKVLDMGTGSGAIICALKHEMPNLVATALDFQPEALKVAQQNAKRLGLDIHFLQSDWFSAIEQSTYDVIVSNPPYIEEADPHLLQGDVRFEPSTALTAGQTGLNDIQHLIQHAKRHLNDQAWLILEHGYNQEAAVKQLFKEHGYQQIETIKDYQQNARVTLGQWLTRLEKPHEL